MKKVIVVVGPTGVGKTKLSIELSKVFDGEVINADSTQVYTGMDIATAKVTEKEKDGISHHLFDIKSMEEDYTAYHYQTDARNKIEEIFSENKTPIMVGGTGLYIKSCLYDYQFKEETLKNEYLDVPLEELYQQLLKIDPTTTIHQNNRKRVIRALNYYEDNKVPLSLKEKAREPIYPVLVIGLTTDRKTLYQRINDRVDLMVKEGLLEEARSIYDSHIRSKAVMTPIGYKELFPYFEGKVTLEHALDEIKKNSRHYAKRQYTWLRHQMDVTWFEVNFDHFYKTVEEVIRYIEAQDEI